MKNVFGLALIALLMPLAAVGQSVKGQLSANGKSTPLTHAAAYEVDSATERGYMDVIVILSDRALPPEVALNTDKLQEMMLNDGLSALRVVIDPDCKVKSAAPYHPALKNFIQSGVFVKWKPSAYNEKEIAGRLYTDGQQNFAGQHWSYDLIFSAPINLDPEAKTVPGKKK